VISYQGDGDLASIGLAEAMQAAQLGIPLTFIFVNNAIYGMTGGQMAPTTLMGQKTATSPDGRSRMMGQPLRMAEIMAGLDGPVYVERVALFDGKQRIRARKAILKALQLQVENKGLGFVEVLAECPLHLGKTPEEAQQWVKESMVPVFPLGVKKDIVPEPWPEWKEPSFDASTLAGLLGASSEEVPRFSPAFPREPYGGDIALKLAGAGGDGAQTAAMLVARAAINEGFDATHIPSYGPESRGGTASADVRLAEREVLSPACPAPHVLVAFNAPSLARFSPAVVPGGTIVYDSSVAEAPAGLDRSVRTVGVPCSDIARGLGRLVVKNIVAVGALQAATALFPEETFLAAIRQALKDKAALVPLNEQAFRSGVAAAAAQMKEA
jgi:2-oxoisovalerate ferredoxin oxidoreductase beta subunit